MAALLTYYGFLSLFPLLLAATSVLQIILHSRPGLRDDVISHATQYFPVIGQQLQSNVQNVHGAGIALAVGILVSLWGAKGIADVFQNSLNNIWGISRVKRPGFPKNSLKSLGIIFFGGVGLIAASFLSGYAASLDQIFIFRVFSAVISLLVLFALFWWIFKFGLASSKKVSKKALLRSALTAALGIQVLQIIGGYLITHELSRLQNLYGTFAATLGLFFWIYLQARIIIYAAEAGSVYGRKLWPRSLVQDELTEADERAYTEQAKKEKVVPPEKIKVTF